MPPRAPLPLFQLTALAASYSGRDMLALGTTFDTAQGAYIVRFVADGPRGDHPRVYVVNETSGELVTVEDDGYHVAKPLRVYDYTSSMEPTGSPYSQPQVSAPMNIVPYGAFSYEHRLGSTAFGEPTLVQYMANASTCGIAARTNASVLAASTAATPWTSVTTGNNFRMANAYYQMTRLNALRLHYSSGFAAYTQLDEPFKLTLVDCLTDFDGIYFPNNGSGGDLQLAVQGSESWRFLGTMSHEYGHHVHSRFGLRGSPAVVEGFADTFPMRWLFYAQLVNSEYSGLNYNSAVPGSGAANHSTISYNGEQLPGAPNSIVYHPFLCSPNEDANGGNHYSCGQVLSYTYWELAWDVCRTGYGSCNEGQDIIQTGAYAYDARSLANGMFAYAISTLITGDKIADFMNLVDDAYALANQNGVIANNDYQRAVDAMAHHCVGSGSLCGIGGYHRLPGSPLTSAETRKSSLFFEAEAGLLSTGTYVLYENQSSSGSFIWLNTGNSATFGITMPASSTGNYDIKFVGRYYSNPSSSVTISLGGSSQNVSVPGYGWQWYSTTSPYALTSGNHYTFQVSRNTGNVDVDAVVLVKR